jgi:hypothetical protein
MLEDKFQGFGRGDEFQVERSVLAKCINKVNWLLALDLARNSCNKVLEIEYYLKDLNICLASLLAPPLSGSMVELT